MVGRVGRSEDRGSSQLAMLEAALSQRSQEGIAQCRSREDVRKAVRSRVCCPGLRLSVTM